MDRVLSGIPSLHTMCDQHHPGPYGHHTSGNLRLVIGTRSAFHNPIPATDLCPSPDPGDNWRRTSLTIEWDGMRAWMCF